MPFATNTTLIRFFDHKTNSLAEMSLEDVSVGLGARAGAAEAAGAEEPAGCGVWGTAGQCAGWWDTRQETHPQHLEDLKWEVLLLVFKSGYNSGCC